LLVLAVVRVEIERGRVRYIAPGIIRHDGDVIAYLILLRPAFGGIKWLTDRHVGRPGRAGVCAIGIEQLRKQVAGVVAGIVPHGVKPSIGRH
jgi:hypothetical protein